jgi:hypothetical protein
MDNWTLACCGGPDIPVYQQCANSTKCAALELEGACCPTPDGKYLDCCGAVPDECKEPGACPVYSAVEYKLELEAAKRAAESNAYAIAGTAATTLLIVMVAFVAL